VIFPLQTSFVPRELLALTRQSVAGTHLHTFHGAALFLDIEGYTRLTDRLTSDGPEGVERLSSLLNQAFSHYLETIHRWGGEVAVFAGDALLAYWPDRPNSNPAQALDSALACSRQLCRSRSEDIVDTGAESFPPRLRIGLGIGEMWAAKVGPDHRSELIFAGPAVREATLAKQQGTPGEVSLGPAAHKLQQHVEQYPTATSGDLPPPKSTQKHPSSLVSLSVDDPYLDHFRHWMPPRARDPGAERWLPEIRNVVPIFASFTGFDVHDQRCVPRLDALAHRLRSALRPVAAAGGQLLVDDNGLIFLAVLGLAHASRGQEELRAARVALDLCAVAKAEGCEVQVGLTRGRAFSGVIGNARRSAYVTVGPPMNVASRLMASAPLGQILCTSDLADRARGFTCTSRPDLSVKGLHRPLKVSTIEISPEQNATVEGRDKELDALESLVIPTDHGTAGSTGAAVCTGWVIVTGEAGIGKSSLVDALVRRLANRGKILVRGGLASADTLVGYGALQPLFRWVFGIETRASPSSTALQIQRYFEERPRQRALAPLLNSVFSLRSEDTQQTRALLGGERAEATQRLLADACCNALDPNTVILLDDLQWFDSASLRLLGSLLRRAEGPVFLATARSTKLTERDSERARLPAAQELQLGPLDRSGVADLVRALASDIEISGDLADEIFERSGGHPFFARELLLAIRRRTATSGELPLRAAAPPVAVSDDFAAALEGLVSSRLDALSRRAQRALKFASVIGSSFDPGLLLRIMPEEQDPNTFNKDIKDLHDADFLVAQEHGRWQFTHEFVRDVAYALLLYRDRRALHQAIASELATGKWGSRSAEIFRHYDAAGDGENRVRWATTAADEAMVAGAWKEAIRLLHPWADDNKKDPHQGQTAARIRGLRYLSEAHGHLGQTKQRRRYAYAALDLARPQQPGLLSTCVAWSGILVRGPTRSQRRQEINAVPSQVARAHAQAAEVAYFDNDMLTMVRHTLRAIQHDEAAGQRGSASRHYATLGGILGVAGAHRLGSRHLARAIKIAQDTRDEPSQIFAQMVRALYGVGRGDWALAESSAVAGQALAHELRLHSDWGNIQIVRFWIRFYRGEFDEAQHFAQRLVERSLESGHDQHESWGTRGLGVVLLARGQPDAAIVALRRSLVVPERDGAAGEQIESLGSLALAYSQIGHADDTHAVIKQLLALDSAMPHPLSHAHTIALRNAAKASSWALSHSTDVEEWWAFHRRIMAKMKRTARAFPVARPALASLRETAAKLRRR